ncbi:GlsB/YeaQ/YmgE family stress response membrane protein [Archangium sp.]|uniref:GlsB/YeaQ/YmgE family stress response membrane protein n=1 Tax=Archangium sp. TaxID=1872627 RepID=UPI00286B998B|nr:GlsB/YeaQ/YmgE family stress response membrane protein [Archangium sp.]
MGLVAIIVLGLVAGLLARVIVPGRSGMGIVGTIVLGIVGSSGLIFSTIGAVIVLVIVNSVGLGARRS